MNEMSLEPYSARLNFKMSSPLSDRQWRILLAEYMETLARQCCEERTCIIGHIKGLTEFAENGFLKVSVTSLDQPAEVEGKVPSNISELSFVLNVLVYGLTREEIVEMVGKTISRPDSLWLGHVNIG